MRARITVLEAPVVASGARRGSASAARTPGERDEWLQVGIAALPGMEPLLYAESPGPAESEFLSLEETAHVGETQNLAVLEMSKRPGWWRVWVGGQPASAPIRLPGSSGRWQPIATAESWNGGQQVCNRFAFRFERVGVAGWRGGSWRIRSGKPLPRSGICLAAACDQVPAPPGRSPPIRPFAFEAVSS